MVAECLNQHGSCNVAKGGNPISSLGGTINRGISNFGGCTVMYSNVTLYYSNVTCHCYITVKCNIKCSFKKPHSNVRTKMTS